MKQLRILSFARSALQPGEIGVDLFAGGGGWSEGFQWATGVPPAVAVNHDEHAIEMHIANHPESEHHHCDIYEVDPVKATRGRPVGWLHLSPDCTHFSRAKGGKPRSQKIRALAWVALTWAEAVLPRIISLENVAEFITWGPLDEHGKPIKARQGETFELFISRLRELGYEVEWKKLTAADYGAPTTRTRLFLIARRDGQPIRWPEPTHGPGLKPYRTAAECIDWTIPCPSIFDRKKPLAEATQRRIAEGIRRYVLENPKPFLIQTGYGEREGQAPRVLDLDKPLGTVVAGGQKHALVAAFLAKHYTGVIGHTLERPLGTITAWDHHSLVAAHITKFHSGSVGIEMDRPMPTVTSNSYGKRPGGAAPLGLVAAFLAKYYGNDKHGQGLKEPMHTVPTVDRFGLVTVRIDGETFVLTDIGMRMLQPRELARAQGFPDSYVLTGTKTAKVARIGNSVCPQIAEAIVNANLPEVSAEEVAA